MMQALAHLFQIRCHFVESWQNYGVADSITCLCHHLCIEYIYIIFQSPVVLWAPHTTLCFCSSVRTSLRTLAQGMSSGHQMGLQLSFPQPGFPRPVEYFSISGMNARSWACKATKGAYNHCGSFNTGSGRAKHGLWKNKICVKEFGNSKPLIFLFLQQLSADSLSTHIACEKLKVDY